MGSVSQLELVLSDTEYRCCPESSFAIEAYQCFLLGLLRPVVYLRNLMSPATVALHLILFVCFNYT